MPDDDDDDDDDPMILNIRAKYHTSERTIVPWTVIFSILANINVSLLANSKVDMVNVFEGGGGEEVERYCVIIIFSIHFFCIFQIFIFSKILFSH